METRYVKTPLWNYCKQRDLLKIVVVFFFISDKMKRCSNHDETLLIIQIKPNPAKFSYFCGSRFWFYGFERSSPSLSYKPLIIKPSQVVTIGCVRVILTKAALSPKLCFHDSSVAQWWSIELVNRRSTVWLPSKEHSDFYLVHALKTFPTALECPPLIWHEKTKQRSKLYGVVNNEMLASLACRFGITPSCNGKLQIMEE